jgi:alternate signal-mediated exported protein
MNKTIKGAFAASTAAVLLMGGAGSLAYWSDSDTTAGATITAGELDIDAASCNTAGWTVSNTVEKVSNVAFVPGTDAVVPGDVLTKTCTVAIRAVGKDLRASLAVTPPTATGTMASDSYTLTSSFTRGTESMSVIKPADANKTINAVITVAFPIKTTVDNASMLKNVNLSAITVTATQAVA